MRARWLLGLQLVAVALLLPACSTGTDEAKHGVSEFRARVAQGALAEIYGAASSEFRQSTSEEQFRRLMASHERRLGTWQSAPDPVWNVLRSTSGHFVTLTYESQFSRGPAVEQFAWRIERDTPILIGYNVRSSLLVMD